jgi:hypothetical protein
MAVQYAVFFGPSASDAEEAKAAIDRLVRAALETPAIVVSDDRGHPSPEEQGTYATGAKQAAHPSDAAPTTGVRPGQGLQQADVLTLYFEMAQNSLSPRLVEALSTDPHTFAELAEKMPPRDGAPLSTAQMRAVHRNAKRSENRLINQGSINGPVIQSDFSRYDADGGGRYYLRSADLKALDEYLGR